MFIFLDVTNKQYHVIFVFLWLFLIWNYFVTVSGNFAHTTFSLSLSRPPFLIQGPHMYTKVMCVKMSVVFFWEGDLFCLKRWTTLLPRYSWTQNMSSRNFQAAECLSEGRVHNNQLQTGAKWPSCFRTPRADIHPVQLLFIDRKEAQ